jgi:hypothetical protein
MNNKTFVSIYFSTNKLQVLKLSLSKKKVEKFATQDLPQGMIAGRKVQDPKVLGQLIKNIWNKMKLTEKSVGLVVPEFSTFIKNFSLPKIEIEDLDEAIRWQAQEFLPKPINKMSLDWRIIKRFESEYQILVVALEKEILQGYVEAVDYAGLFPLVVETPSLSLARVSKMDKYGKLIVYRFFDELILVIADEEKILGSSVLNPNDTNEIIGTAKKIINHFKDVKVQKVLIGGTQLDEQLISGLNSNLKLEMNRLNVSVAGLSTEDIQNYLIPLSHQYKEISEPEDENTINLLPPALLEKYDSKRFQVRVWSLLMITTFIAFSSFFITLGTYLFLNQQISTFRKDNGTKLNVVVETEGARNQIKKINETSDKTIRVVNGSLLPHDVLNPIYEIKPEGVRIDQYDIDLDLGTVVLNGVALTRTDLINFKKAIEQDENFVQVSLPISSFEVESNLNFELSFIYSNPLNTVGF